MPQAKKNITPEPNADELYAQLFQRNQGYISDELQQKIRTTKLLIAGCGVGSAFAEAAVRMGFEQITLIDGDTVAISNLNRQTFTYADVGAPKVMALANRLRAINPNASIKEHNAWITVDNATAFVDDCDLIFDTIDFLDMVAITAVHDAANRLKKPIISSLSAGWGAMACYFPPTDSDVCMFRKVFGLPDYGSVQNNSYVKHFAKVSEKLAETLEPEVVKALSKALEVMEDGTPCPASHVSAGSFGVAALSVTVAARIINGEKVIAFPEMIVTNMGISAAGGTSKPILL